MTALAEALSSLAELDLASVRDDLSGAGPRWPRHIVNELQLEYLRFLALRAAYPDAGVAPSAAVQRFWDAHAELDEYAEQTREAVGQVVEHEPGDGEEQPLEATLELYERHFGTPGALWFPELNHRLWLWALQGELGAPAPEAVTASVVDDPVLGDKEAELGDPAAQGLETSGFVHLGAALSPAWVDRLRTEAEESRQSAQLYERDSYEVYGEGGAFRSPQRNRSAPAGPVLAALHEHPTVLGFARRATGQPLMPTRASFLYYDEGDFLGLHTDLPSCSLTMLTSLAGDAPPLVVNPHLRGTPPEQLEPLSRTAGGFPEGGVEIPVTEAGLSLLLGSQVPHHRRAIEDPSEELVVTMCYAPLV